MSQQYSGLPTYQTKVVLNNGMTEVVFYQTPVVAFNEDKIILNTGGWWTRTTKTRMNQASEHFDLRFHIYQKNGGWFVTFGENTVPFESDTVSLVRQNGNK